MIPFIDISRHQGTVDFKVMASRNVPGVICRAGNGTRIDPTFVDFTTRARAAGMVVGAYWFCNPRVGSARQQGEMLAAAHNAMGCELPPMLDVEDYTREAGSASNDLYGPRFAAWLHDMADTVAAGTGRDPLIYTNAAYWNPSVNDTTFGHLDLVCARYPFYSPAACAANVPPVDARDWDDWLFAATSKRPQVPRGWDTWAAWQFSAGYNGRGHVYGCTSADLDLNIARDDAWERWIGTTAPPPLEDDMPVRPVPERIYDTRLANVPLAAGEVREVPIWAQTVGVNITVVSAADDGYLTAWGAGPKPGTSNVQFRAGVPADNYAQVMLDGGRLRLSSTSACHVIVDLQAAS
jgi:GH25 family lysozyme M1 (1,4-beta-N-acetylmuramidase)